MIADVHVMAELQGMNETHRIYVMTTQIRVARILLFVLALLGFGIPMICLYLSAEINFRNDQGLEIVGGIAIVAYFVLLIVTGRLAIAGFRAQFLIYPDAIELQNGSRILRRTERDIAGVKFINAKSGAKLPILVSRDPAMKPLLLPTKSFAVDDALDAWLAKYPILTK